MAIKADKGFSLKDDLFNKQTVQELAAGIERAYPDFKRQQYTNEAVKAFGNLELKERIDFLVHNLSNHLPADYPKALKILQSALPPKLDPTKTDNDFGKFIWIVPGQFAAEHGVTQKHLQRSLKFLREATMRFSSELAIRPFLKAFPDETMTHVHSWAADKNYHVRRLASEGIRPLLPWAMRVQLPAQQVVDVLSLLHADPARFVTRSVANTLNDISKSNPELVIATLRDWQKQKQQQPKELAWMTKHAARTLLKQDHPPALSLLGYAAKPKISFAKSTATKSVAVGESFRWQTQLVSEQQQQLKINMKIEFLKNNGSYGARVFAVEDRTFNKGEILNIDKRQPFKPLTTRTLYTGKHYAELVVNGVSIDRREFEVTN